MYLLDTNICIYALNGKHPSLKEKLLTISPESIFISSITVGELEYGASKSKWGERTRETMYSFLANYAILPFIEEDALLFGKIRADLSSSGNIIGSYDLMIAVQGITRNLTVITHNVREFQRVPGIVLDDWVQ